jgi:hypothetical protein
MQTIYNNADKLRKKISVVQNKISKHNWSALERNLFLDEFENGVNELKGILAELLNLERELKLLLEKGTPDLSPLINEIKKELMVLDSNLSMERSKPLEVLKLNELDRREMPDLYHAMQSKLLDALAKALASTQKAITFIETKQMPFIKKNSSAKDIIALLQKKEEEIGELKKKQAELRRENYFTKDISSVELEHEAIEADKKISQLILETNNSTKTHYAQIEYLNGSYSALKNKFDRLESAYTDFEKKTITLIKQLKEERDHARVTAMQIENETSYIRGEHATKIIEAEKRIAEAEERAVAKKENEMKIIKKDIDDSKKTITNLLKVIEQQEKEIKLLKQRASIFGENP